MKCEEVQSHFSDYLDKTAEAPRAKGIENHLTNCPICSEEFAGLLQCRQLVSGLPEVEPPLGFTMRTWPMPQVSGACGSACSCR